MPEVPTMKARDVSPLSAYNLSPTAAFVVASGRRGKLDIYSQHTSLDRANQERKRGRRYRQGLRVYRVEREK